MSVQLIVFPQSYDGILNPIASPPINFIPNPNGAYPYDMISTVTSMGNPVILDAFSVNPPQTNGWLSFITNFDGIPYVSGTFNNITLNSGQCSGGTSPFTTTTGAYYALSNLTIGATYNLIADIIPVVGSGGTGTITLSIWNGNTNITSIDYPNTVAPMSLSWVAQTANDVVVISFVAIDIAWCDYVRVGNLSVLAAVQPPTPPTNYSSGEVILDLYEDEDIPLTLSVDNFKNIAEKVQSYSKAFKIPETKRNKRIFDQIFEITRATDGLIFNPYKKTECTLKQNGLVLFQGFLRLLNISDKNGEVSYNVNLYSETIALADTLKEKTLQDLSFYELSHEYQRTNIKNSWNDSGTGIAYINGNSSGFRDANKTLKYPFVNWTNQIPISNGSIGVNGFPYLTGLGQAFRPFLQVKYLVDRIFQDSLFTYTSTFFGTSDFEKLYMDFNWGDSREPNINIGTGTGENANFTTNYATTAPAWTAIVQDTETYTAATELGYDATTAKFTATFDGQIFSGSFNTAVRATPTSVGTNNQYMGILKAQIQDSLGNDIGTVGYEEFYTTNDYASFFEYQVGFAFNATLQTGQSLIFVFQRSSDCSQLWQFYSNYSGLSWTVNMITTIQTGTALTSSASLALRGELSQWDFLKGIITMFNLITMPDPNNPSNILIEPYADIFINNSANVRHNWTDKVDASEIKLTPLSDLNKKTIFKFVEDEDDFPFQNYKNQVQQHLYGSKKYIAGSEFNILDGTNEIVAEPFAATVVKPIMSQFGAFVTPAIYSYNANDGTSEGFDNSPRIMYNNGIKDSGISYHIPLQNGVAADDEIYYLQFSHLTDIPTVVSVPPDPITDTIDFHFGECQLLVGNATPYNLFNMYWLPYFNELYNPDTRTLTLKVNLNPSDINLFKFSDTVMILNRDFRVNKIDYKPNDLATVEFILIT